MTEEIPISSRRVYEGRIVRLRVDEVELPGGRRAIREVMEHPGAVGIVPLDEAGRVILVRQFRYAVGQRLLEIPAGTLAPGEDPLDTADRELQEETGLKAGRFSLLAVFYPSPGVSTECIWVYLAEQLTQGTGQAEEDESIEVVKIPLDEALNLIASGEIRDAKSIVGLVLAKNYTPVIAY